jgi:hypothetical protein
MFRILFCSVLAIMAFSNPALAQQVADDGRVSIPWGDVVASAQGLLLTLAGSALAFALARLPASVLTMIKTWQVDQLLEKSIAYGINMVAGAAKGQQLSVPVGNKVLEQALEYAIENGSPKLIKWLCSTGTLEKRILARLDLAPEAGASSLVTKAQVASK